MIFVYNKLLAFFLVTASARKRLKIRLLKGLNKFFKLGIAHYDKKIL